MLSFIIISNKYLKELDLPVLYDVKEFMPTCYKRIVLKLIKINVNLFPNKCKELILVPRETPYNLIHIRNMETVTLAGGIICPAVPSFYSNPATMDELVQTVIDRVLQLAGFKLESYRWGGS